MRERKKGLKIPKREEGQTRQWPIGKNPRTNNDLQNTTQKIKD